jgi:hypothetical protein
VRRGKDHCSLDDAKRYEHYGNKIEMRDGKLYRVEHPDWRSHSWLTIPEFREVLNRYNKKYIASGEPMNERWGVEYRALLVAMEKLEKSGDQVRLVFFFDN